MAASLLSNMYGKALDESTKTIASEEVTLGQKRKPTGLAEPSKPGPEILFYFFSVIFRMHWRCQNSLFTLPTLNSDKTK